MKRLSIAILLLSSALLHADTLTPDALVKDAAKFDGKPVTVAGKIEKLERKTSRAGNKYYVLKLKGEKESVNVYGQGELDAKFKDGDKAQAFGTFRKEKKIRDFTVKNEVDVTAKDGKKFALTKTS